MLDLLNKRRGIKRNQSEMLVQVSLVFHIEDIKAGMQESDESVATLDRFLD